LLLSFKKEDSFFFSEEKKQKTFVSALVQTSQDLAGERSPASSGGRSPPSQA
jgi:hypothetical protein